MNNFCTLFDSVYLSRGLLLYESIKEKSNGFHLYIFAFDGLAYEILIKLRLESATIISLKEFENQDLLNVKETRTRAEYCWTCTSSVIDFVLSNYKVPSCTYLDADLFFYNSPDVLLNELDGNKTVLITEHRFSKFASLIEKKRAGRFCVQFITFTDDKNSRDVLKKWIGQCIDWCYDRYEKGKFGDQKYLETWPEEYANVHILEHKGGGVAPWNAGQYRFIKGDNRILGVDSEKNAIFEVIFFHFHYVRIIQGGYADLGWNRLRQGIIDLFYKPYIQKLISMEKYLETTFPEYKMTIQKVKLTGTKDIIKHLYKRIVKFNLIMLPKG